MLRFYDTRSWRLGIAFVLTAVGMCLTAGLVRGVEPTTPAPYRLTIHSASKIKTAGYEARELFDRSGWFVEPTPLFDSKAVLSVTRSDDAVLEWRLDDAAWQRLRSATPAYLAMLLGDDLRFVAEYALLEHDGLVAIRGLTPTQCGQLAALLGYPFLDVEGPRLGLVSRAPHVRPGDEVLVDVYLRGVTSLGAYQVSLESVRGRRGSLIPHRLMVDDQRSDFVLRGHSAKSGADPARWMVWGDGDGAAVDVLKPGYLGTFVFRSTPDALGTFVVRTRSGPASYVQNAEGLPVEFRGGSAIIQIADDSTPWFHR